MKIILLVLATVIVASEAATYSMPMLREWATFKINHNKEYDHELEENLRMKIFFNNKRIIEEHNTRYEQGLTTFTLGVNQFADLTLEEFKQTMLNFNKSGNADFVQNNVPVKSEIQIPESIDWTKYGAVTSIKDQDQCGSCWAFSAVSSLESAHFLKTGTLVSLSEKQLVDCSSAYGNMGCNGGSIDDAFDYIMAVGGIESESEYPYKPMEGVCAADKSKFIVQVANYTYVQHFNETNLQEFVGTRGPTSVSIDADHDSIRFYKNGVYYEESCSQTQLDHGVTVVGYDTTDDGNKYWLVRNSWGTIWGEQGYIKMARDKDNNCGIATLALIPIV